MKKETELLHLKLEREKKIKSTITRLKKPFKEIEKNKLNALGGLFKEIAFMEVHLEELREDMNLNGMIEIFEQGSQRFERERPAVKIYNNTLSKYQSCMKQVIDILPEDVKKKEDSKLNDFVRKANLIRTKC